MIVFSMSRHVTCKTDPLGMEIISHAFVVILCNIGMLLVRVWLGLLSSLVPVIG